MAKSPRNIFWFGPKAGEEEDIGEYFMMNVQEKAERR